MNNNNNNNGQDAGSPRSPHVQAPTKTDEGEALEALGSLLRRPTNNKDMSNNNKNGNMKNAFDDVNSSSNRLLNALKSLDSPTWNAAPSQPTFSMPANFDCNQSMNSMSSLNMKVQDQDLSKKRRAPPGSLTALHQSILMDTNVEDLKMVKPTSSKYRGVSWHSRAKTWTARVWNAAENKSIHLGVFNTELRAALAFDLKARELFGRKFKGFNFPCSKERVALIRTLVNEDSLPSSDDVKDVLSQPEASIQKLAKSTDNRSAKKRRQSQ